VGWETFNLFFNGRHAAVNNTTEGLRWRHLDHLGNLRLKTDNTGQARCYYYYKPYGEISYKSCTEADDYWFTGKERDAETGLDYFGARYHGSAIGRFTSVDPIGGFTEVPQSLNKYAYGLNNPLRYADADGQFAVPVIPLGGILIGGVWGGIDAYINQTGYGKGIFSGAMGGLAASMTYPWNPIYAGAITGGVTNISGQLYDTAFTEKTWRDIDLVSLGIDTTMGALIGRVLGPVTTSIQRWKWQGLIPPRPGPGLVPARFTTYYGPKAKDLHRAFGLSGFFGSSYHMATHEIGSTYTPADLSSYRLRLLEGIARGSQLRPDVRIGEITYGPLPYDE
jgi:RHS repeat-associated protein